MQTHIHLCRESAMQRMPKASKAMSMPPKPDQRSITRTRPWHGRCHGNCGNSPLPLQSNGLAAVMRCERVLGEASCNVGTATSDFSEP